MFDASAALLSGEDPPSEVHRTLSRCSVQEAGDFAGWAFQGGTALRFLHDGLGPRDSQLLDRERLLADFLLREVVLGDGDIALADRVGPVTRKLSYEAKSMTGNIIGPVKANV